ncbi:hypothetical protein JDV09_24955 [Mycobacterium sp. Y57]|uniref:hypothetical protein n=1 Tax=Mycolicibacterium xanthum TaxID=2796469 RepID=UPI001C8457D2|nr:hypothetical protein [Mycolicibacterium xanthum]MBX7435324.1 hypothetical protein [Mycolicibacterium xanthum]
MQIKEFATGAATVAALGCAALGIGSGVAQAKPHNPLPPIPVPGDPIWWNPGGPPGHNPFGPPGQVMQGNPVVPGLTGVPPGHWNDPVSVGLPPLWRPANWVELGIEVPQPVVWNPDANRWGIWWRQIWIPFV